MQAIPVTGPSEPQGLRVVERPVPSPGPGQVLVEIAYAGVNRHDCNQRRRGHPPAGATDILGLEVSGRIVETGDGVPAARRGEHVCALVNGGGYAEYCLAESALALPVPGGLAPREAAALPEACFTAWLNVVELGRLGAGATLLVHGGASGVGTVAIQLATALGAQVIATAGSEEKCRAALRLGAQRAIDYRREEFVAAVMEATAGRGVDVILDLVGGLYAKRNLAALAPDGRLVHISGAQEPVFSAPLQAIMEKRATVTGSLLRPLPAARKTAIAAKLLETVWPRIGTGIVPLVDSVFPLARAGEAHLRMESGGNIGKILLAVRG